MQWQPRGRTEEHIRDLHCTRDILSMGLFVHIAVKAWKINGMFWFSTRESDIAEQPLTIRREDWQNSKRLAGCIESESGAGNHSIVTSAPMSFHGELELCK